MPEYLAPGVFVEEVTFRQKSIEGVSTSTTGFIGAVRFGPTEVEGEAPLLTSFGDFERIYGGLDRLEFENTTGPSDNDVAHAVRAFFEEGGKRLYLSRTFNPIGEDDPAVLQGNDWTDGRARWRSQLSPAAPFSLVARYPGRAGNFTVTFVFRAGENVMSTDPVDPADLAGPQIPVLRGVNNFDVVLADAGAGPQTFWVERYFDDTILRDSYRLRRDDPANDPAAAVTLDQLVDGTGTPTTEVRVITVGVLVQGMGRFVDEKSWEELTFHPDHRASLLNTFGDDPIRRSFALYHPFVFETDLANGALIAEALMDLANRAGTGSVFDTLLGLFASPPGGAGSEAERTVVLELTGGNDGNQPIATQYEGDDGGDTGLKSGLRAFEDIEDISILAAPGSSRDLTVIGGANNADAISRQLIAHCERMRYRVAVLDSVDGQTLGDVRVMRSGIDTTRAALYYPWVRIFDPITEREILQPPSGFVAGIYARTDIERGVHKAPANETVRLALGFEFLLNTAQQEALNPLGINCLRYFEGRGFRVWGARTASSDPEWKYLNVRRYFAFLERSIEKGTQWAVFEPNGPVLWANVRRTIEDFLFNEWKQNHLFGAKPDEAYFVRCDRSTMTQNDIDNGRLVCQIGVAPLRPAEFVIFRIGQKTLDSAS